jgi:hypothetical protein
VSISSLRHQTHDSLPNVTTIGFRASGAAAASFCRAASIVGSNSNAGATEQKADVAMTTADATIRRGGMSRSISQKSQSGDKSPHSEMKG